MNNANSVINNIIPRIVDNIVLPLVEFIFVLAILVFIWGLIGLFANSDDFKKHEESKSHILWGIVGITIMVSVYGIIRLVASTVGQSSVLGF